MIANTPKAKNQLNKQHSTQNLKTVITRQIDKTLQYEIQVLAMNSLKLYGINIEIRNVFLV